MNFWCSNCNFDGIKVVVIIIMGKVLLVISKRV